ncbi:hypothetical protein RCU16_03560 [Escherichia coli]|nr:hypothetical protein [Escherichia coli]MEC9995347.1 hypothetical protein [Escherichia coli]
MLHTNNPIIKHKVGLLNLAEELGNVSKACKIMGNRRKLTAECSHQTRIGNLDAHLTQTDI